MWIVREDVVMRVPDDAPLPSGSSRIEVPDEFIADPSAFTVQKGRLIAVGDETSSSSRSRQTLKLTQDEIKILKDAIADGRIGSRKQKGDSHGKASE